MTRAIKPAEGEPAIETVPEAPEIVVEPVGQDSGSCPPTAEQEASVETIILHEDAEGALSIDGEPVEEAPVDEVDPVAVQGDLDVLANAIRLLDPSEAVLAMKVTEDAIIVVTSHGRKFAVDPDGWISQSSGPDLCVVAMGEDAPESADARAD